MLAFLDELSSYYSLKIYKVFIKCLLSIDETVKSMTPAYGMTALVVITTPQLQMRKL